MEQSQLDALQTWFDSYVQTYNDIDEEGFRNILLKVEHTRKVCEIMALLAEGEELTPDQARIDSLKKQKDVATQRLKAERDRQKRQKAVQQLASLNGPLKTA